MALIVLALAPWWGDRQTLRLIVEIFTYVALASLWNLLAGYAGLVSVGQQAFVGLGGYVLFALADPCRRASDRGDSHRWPDRRRWSRSPWRR